MPFIKNNILRYTLITAIIILLAGGGWFFHFSLTPYQVSPEQVQAHYAYQAGNDLHWKQTKIEIKEKGQILTSHIKQSRSFSYCNLTFLSSSINAFNLPTVLDIAE